MRPALKHRPTHSPVAALPASRRSPSSLPAVGRRVAASLRRHGGSKKYSWIQQKPNMVEAKTGAARRRSECLATKIRSNKNLRHGSKSGGRLKQNKKRFQQKRHEHLRALQLLKHKIISVPAKKHIVLAKTKKLVWQKENASAQMATLLQLPQ